MEKAAKQGISTAEHIMNAPIEEFSNTLYGEFPITFEKRKEHKNRPYIIRVSAVLPVPVIKNERDVEYWMYKVETVSNRIDWKHLNFISRLSTDAKLVGANTLRLEEEMYWSLHGDQFEDLKRYNDSLDKKVDINIMLTRKGDINLSRKVFNIPEIVRPVIIAATQGYQLLMDKKKTNRYGVRVYTVDNMISYKKDEIQRFLKDTDPSVLIVPYEGELDHELTLKFFRHGLDIEKLSLEAGPEVANEFQKWVDKLYLTEIPEDADVERVGKYPMAKKSELNTQSRQVYEFIEKREKDSKETGYPIKITQFERIK